jgi:hypothetical protein
MSHPGDNRFASLAYKLVLRPRLVLIGYKTSRRGPVVAYDHQTASERMYNLYYCSHDKHYQQSLNNYHSTINARQYMFTLRSPQAN